MLLAVLSRWASSDRLSFASQMQQGLEWLAGYQGISKCLIGILLCSHGKGGRPFEKVQKRKKWSIAP